MKPKVIVADESVSALDVSIKAQVINLMLELQERLKLAFLFISHDMAVVERVSHRVAVMYLGEIVEIGPREAIFGNPQHPYTKRLLAAVPVPDPARRLEKRPVSSEALDAAVAHICHKLRALGEREVASRLVGELAMEELHSLDEVAYVRFASVYRASASRAFAPRVSSSSITR